MKRFIFALALSLATLGMTGASWAGPVVGPPGSCYDACLADHQDCASGLCGPIDRFVCYDYYQTCFDSCTNGNGPWLTC